MHSRTCNFVTESLWVLNVTVSFKLRSSGLIWNLHIYYSASGGKQELRIFQRKNAEVHLESCCRCQRLRFLLLVCNSFSYHCFVYFLFICHLYYFHPCIGCKRVCFRSSQNETVMKCNEMRIGECIIHDKFDMTRDMFYLFNGTYEGEPVNNTFKDKRPAQYGKHALFAYTTYTCTERQLNNQFSQIQHTMLRAVIFTTANYLRKKYSWSHWGNKTENLHYAIAVLENMSYIFHIF